MTALRHLRNAPLSDWICLVCALALSVPIPVVLSLVAGPP